MEFSIKDFDKLDIYSKSTLATVIVLFPFWYIFIFLFNKPFYKESDVFLKVLFAFCFSIIWYFVNIATMLVELQVFRKEEPMPSVFRYSGFRCICYIGIYILLAYTTFKFSFLQYLTGAYVWLIVFNAMAIGVDLIFRKRKIKEQ
jgi:hypothetical protein